MAELVATARRHLGNNYVGTYLHGSLATGGFDNASDIDFLVVTRRRVDDEQAGALRRGHQDLHRRESHWAKHLEGSYAPLEALAAVPPPRQKLLYLDRGSTTFEWSDHDHCLNVLWVVRERPFALDGPDPRTIIPPITAEALMDETRDDMREWADRILSAPERMSSWWYQSFIVLSYCRMAHTLVTGEIRSKQEGVAWATGALHPRWQGLIAWAGERRLRSLDDNLAPADTDTVAKTHRFIGEVVQRYTSF